MSSSGGSSPSKSGWVQFNEDGGGGGGGGGGESPSKDSSGSGRSPSKGSARGSVNSLAQHNRQLQDATLDVSDIQVS